MALFRSTRLNSMEDLFWMQVNDLYSAEQQLIETLPRMVEAAHDPRLKDAFNENLDETRHQAARLDNLYQACGRKPDGTKCEAMAGLLKESEHVIKADGAPAVRDAALIAAARRVERYEISSYDTLRTIAEGLEDGKAAEMLRESLDEEKGADRLLAQIAEERIKPRTRQER